MFREDLWDNKIIENESFKNEIENLFKNEIIIGQSFILYNFIGEDDLDNEDKLKEEGSNKKNNNNNNEIEINTKENKEDEASEIDDDCEEEEEREIY